MREYLLRLTNEELLRFADNLASDVRSCTADLIESLVEIDKRKLYMGRYTSLFDYCVYKLRMSDSAAYRSIRAARAIQAYPPVGPLLRAGKLTLESLVILNPFLNDADVGTLVIAAAGKRIWEVDRLVAGRRTEAPRRDVVRFIPLSALEMTQKPEDKQPQLVPKIVSTAPMLEISTEGKTPASEMEKPPTVKDAQSPITATPPSPPPLPTIASMPAVAPGVRVAFTADVEFFKLLRQAPRAYGRASWDLLRYSLLMPSEEWSVYLVRCADKSLYTGIAKDVLARVSAHNAGRGAAYTRSRRPVKLVYQKNGMTRSAALIEEARIKSLERPEKISMLKHSVRALARSAAVLALLWAAAPAHAVPVFNAENSIVLTGVAAQSFTGAYPNLRMYYMPVLASTAPHVSSGTTILSALSVDGVTWVADAGVRIDSTTLPSVSLSSITGCAVQRKVDLTYRMLYSIVSTTGAFRIQNAVSADGLTWVNQTAVAVDGVTTYVGVPRIVVIDSGDWRLYYTRDSNGGNDAADRQIFTALSTNEGATWGPSTVVLSTLAYESGASKLTDGRVRLFYTQPAIGSASSATVIVSALSSNALGTTFTQETGARLSTPIAAGAVSFPVAVRSTDTYRWRLYYNYQLAGTFTGDLYSALAAAPAPTAVTPSSVFNSGTNTLTITGEIFSNLPAIPTVSISQGAVTINGTSVASTDDQHITANFLTQGQPLGSWNVNVTNANGVTTTLVGGLTIDFSPGTVLLTNNLLRPRAGVPTSIEVTTFNSGHITVRIHDSSGREIRTLFDDERGPGTFTVTWDGKTASGGSAASGVYLAVTSGPKVATKSKIVLIR